MPGGLLADRALRLEWWQSEPDRPDPVQLEVDLDPRSVGFYDYASAEWFVVPRRTGRRHVVGPYVDEHGTDRYLLTLTAPIRAAGRFLGVAGADVPVAWFEALVFRELGDLAVAVVVVNPEGRVVLSTSAVADRVARGARPHRGPDRGHDADPARPAVADRGHRPLRSAAPRPLAAGTRPAVGALQVVEAGHRLPCADRRAPGRRRPAGSEVHR